MNSLAYDPPPENNCSGKNVYQAMDLIGFDSLRPWNAPGHPLNLADQGEPRIATWNVLTMLNLRSKDLLLLAMLKLTYLE